MIQVRGSARRSFTFPADLPMAYAFFSDVGRLLNYLPHICLVQAYGADRFRLLYSSTELGSYHIRIFADVEAKLGEEWVLRIRPLDGIPPAEAKAGFNASTAQGYFASRSVFRDAGRGTRIEYHLELQANLPTPLAARIMPGKMVNRIARNIIRMRMREIIEGFIDRSVTAFPHWLSELKQHGGVPQSPGPWTIPEPRPDSLQETT